MCLGIDVEGSISHVGWKSDHILRHYTDSNEVHERSVSSKAFAQINKGTAGNLK